MTNVQISFTQEDTVGINSYHTALCQLATADRHIYFPDRSPDCFGYHTIIRFWTKWL